MAKVSELRPKSAGSGMPVTNVLQQYLQVAAYFDDPQDQMWAESVARSAAFNRSEGGHA